MIRSRQTSVEILYEDKDVLVVVKPAGMPSQGDRSSALDMVSYLKNYLSRSGQKDPYIAVIHRLDRPVGGVMIYAKTPKAAKALSAQVKNREVSKYYLAVLTGTFPQKNGTLRDYLKKDDRQNVSRIVKENEPGAKIAGLNYETVKEACVDGQTYSMVRIELLTGRHHQIRVQMAGMGVGIYGDTKYNSLYRDKKGWFPIGLFAYRLSFAHPTTGKQMTFEAEPQGEPFDIFYGGKIMIREVSCREITKQIREMCIEATHYLSEDMLQALNTAVEEEKSPLGKQVLDSLKENLKIAGEDMIPICQDTGMAIVFVKIGQDVHLVDGQIEDAINEGVRQGYVEGFLRKSVVADPLERVNTKDNTPAIIHYSIVPGDRIHLTLAPKGFGSENMSRVVMLKPADGIEGVKKVILDTVEAAGPNACPPLVVGVGIGGDFEKCAMMAKHALTRAAGTHSETPYVADLEKEMLTKINQLGIGPGGLGGTVTALAVNIETYPTHIAGLPVAVNICCHVNRHAVREI